MNGSGSRWWQRPSTWILAIVVFAGVVRLTNIEWDQRHFFHPDERRVAYAVQDLSFKPLQLNPKFFAYGSLPIYLTKITSSLLGLLDPRLGHYDSVIHIGRAVTGVLGTLTVLLTMLLGFRIYDRAAGMLAGFLLAACVLHVQNSKFGCVDVPLTFLVLLALYCLMGVVQRGRTRDFVYAGLAIGLAGATKASAFPMMLPLLVAATHRWRSGDPLGVTLLRLATALVAVFGAFAFGEPYAIVDFYNVWQAADQGHLLGNLKYFWSHAPQQSQFLRDLIEQSGMVRNAGLFPYTNQYVGTAKYGYELSQIILCGMAPLLGLAAIWATGRRAIGIWRERAEEVVLLAWVVPFFLVTGWFEVKFIRYLLPIYPLMILWAAEWLVRLNRRGSVFGRLALPATVVGTMAALVAFLSIYTRPHTVVQASEWLYKFVPAGTKILSQDWDEGFPMPLPGPGMHPERYKIVTFGYYEPDSPAKMRKLATELAQSDYVAFQTKRLYGALTQASQKFPLSSNYFYLLFAGDLGFTLVHEVSARPSLFGLEFPDELVDESFTVYDHPKVLIFRNEGRLEAEAVFNQIMHGLPSQPLTRRDLLLARPGAEVGGVISEPIQSSLAAFLSFALLVEGLGLALYPLARRYLGGASPYALSKVLGVLLFAYVPWLLVSLGQAEFTRETLTVTVLGLGAIGLMGWLRRRSQPISADHGEWVASELLFWGAFLFFLLVRAFNPEVYWGEKPMDFSFLNALSRATTLPPPEPWFAGHDLNYVYYGHYLAAALGKVCHIHPALSFNLAIAFFGGLTAVAAFALGRTLTGSWRLGTVAALFTTLLGNLSGPREYIERHSMNFDYFWATSRVIKDTINEFPLWSFLFADLHAHVMVIPFSLTFLTLLVAWTRQQFDEVSTRSPRSLLLVLLGFGLGTIMVTNGWSTPTYVLLPPFVLGCHWLGASSGRRFGTFAAQLFTRVVFPSILIVLLAYALYLPFFLNFTPPERNWGWELGPLARPRDYAQIFGLFLYVLLPLFFAVWLRVLRPRPAPALTIAPANLAPSRWRPRRAWLEALADPPAVDTGEDAAAKTAEPGPAEEASVFPCELPEDAPACEVAAEAPPLPVPAPALPAPVPRWPGVLRIVVVSLVGLGAIAGLLVSNRLFLAVIGLLGFQLALSRRISARQRLPIALGAFGFFVTAGCDVVYVWDRMNTIFKFYLDSWLIFSAAAAAAIGELWDGGLLGRIGRAIWQAGLVVLIAVAAFTGASGTYGVLTTYRVTTPKPTLNGMAYLEERANYELAAFNWLNQRISGIPVIAEAYGPSYQEFSRVSMNTGLPTVLGWEYHVIQRSHTQADINRRKADLKLIYTSDNQEQVRAALERYHVALVYVGALERRTYGGANLEQFKQWPALLTPVYENAAVSIFAVSGVFTGGIPVTTVEEVPRVGEEEAVAPPQEPEGQLHQPRGIAVDSRGAVYATDFGNARIQKFSPELRFELAWGERGELPGQFRDPCGIAVGPQDLVYVADTWNHRVQVFGADGKYQREWGAGFYGPRGIAVDAKGAVFVADTGNNRVLRFSPTGDQEAAWGGAGKEPGKFAEPVGITTDARGQVYVCDNANARVQIFDRNGAFVSSFPVPGWESKVYSEPYIAVEPKGTIWLSVPGEKEVRAYDAGGRLLRTITGQAIATARFETPMGIAISPATKQVVISDLEHRVLHFPYETR